MLQKQIDELMKLNSERNKKLGVENQKQYGWRPYYRTDGVSVEKGETGDIILKKATTICNEAELGIPDDVIDGAHLVGNEYIYKFKNTNYKSIIMCLSSSNIKLVLLKEKFKIALR